MDSNQLTEELTRIVVTTWDMVAHMPVEPISSIPDHDSKTATFISCVHINGDWLGSVSLECSQRHAKNVASAIFGIDAEQISDQMVSEAMRELVNMTGGNFKSMLGTKCVLSIPKMQEGENFCFTLAETTELAEVNFKIGDQYLRAKAYHSVLNPFDVKNLS